MANLLEEIKISTISELLEVLKDLDTIDLFRGHSSINWDLIPSIGRDYKILDFYEDWYVCEKDIFLSLKNMQYSISEHNHKMKLSGSSWLEITDYLQEY